MRLYLGLGMRKVSSFVNSLVPAVLKPDDLIKVSRIEYSKMLSDLPAEQVFEPRISEFEEELLKRVKLKPNSRILVLFAGGGREAIALAKQGYQVVGIDIVPEVVEQACQNARQTEVEVQFYPQDASRFEFPPRSFEVVVAFARMYGSIPTKKRRLQMLKRIYNVLKQDGVFAFDFALDESSIRAAYGRLFWLRRSIAYLTWGNFGYEVGDRFYGGIEFMHRFTRKEIIEEIEQSGFEVSSLSAGEGQTSQAILKKN